MTSLRQRATLLRRIRRSVCAHRMRYVGTQLGRRMERCDHCGLIREPVIVDVDPSNEPRRMDDWDQPAA